MRYQKDPNGTVRLICYSQDKSHSKRHLVKDPNCKNKKRYNAKDIENVVINELMRISYRTNGNNIKMLFQTYKKRFQNNRQHLKR